MENKFFRLDTPLNGSRFTSLQLGAIVQGALDHVHAHYAVNCPVTALELLVEQYVQFGDGDVVTAKALAIIVGNYIDEVDAPDNIYTIEEIVDIPNTNNFRAECTEITTDWKQNLETLRELRSCPNDNPTRLTI